MSEIDVSDVFEGDWIVTKLLDGELGHFSAPTRRGDPGDTFTVRDAAFEVTTVERRTLDEMDLGPDEREQMREALEEPSLVVHEFERVNQR